MSGDFQTSRELFDHPIWKNIVEFRLFFLIYGKAIFSEDGYWAASDLKLERGQWLRSTRKIQEDLSYIENRQIKTYSTSVINRCIKKLEREQRICTKTHELGTVFTVLNYDVYQGFGRFNNNNLEHNLEQHQNSVGTVEEQYQNNNKKEKKEEERKEDKKTSRPKRVYDTESIPYRSANYLLTKIKEINPDVKEPNIQTWANDMRLLIEIDKRDPAQVGKVIDWIYKNSFWYKNILSPSKLRTQWDRISIEMKEVKPNSKYQSKSDKNQQQMDLLKARMNGGDTVAIENDGARSAKVIDLDKDQFSFF